MVDSPKAAILQQLRSTPGLCGEAVGQRAGLSPTEVAAHIRELRALGYRISADAGGYRLQASPDTPFPWEFGPREALIHHYAELDSTMTAARRLAREGCPPFSVVIAERQTRGRGRLDRRWRSDPGGLYFTVVLRPGIAPTLAARVNLYTCLVLVETLAGKLGIAAAVKWPNDILVDNRKLAGMLAEMETDADRLKFINIGLGVNVNNDPSKLEPRALSLRALLGRRVNRRALLAAFLDRLQAGFAEAAGDGVISRWKTCSATLHRRVEIVTRTGVVRGRAVDMDPTGALVVQCDDGTTVAVTHGDCFHQAGGPP